MSRFFMVHCVEGADVKHVQHSQDNFWWTKRSWVGTWIWAVTEPT